MTYIESDTLSPVKKKDVNEGLHTTDDDLSRAITMGELLAGVKEDIHNIFQSTAR